MIEKNVSVLILMGTRPEVVKMAPIILRLNASSRLKPVVCSTGQHRELLESMLNDFGIKPDIRLDVMMPGQSLNRLAARLFDHLDDVLEDGHFSCILVQGDTTSTLVGAVAGFHRGIPVGHVEAGLRSGDMTAPFPEEFNRRTVSLATRWHFAPTHKAVDALLREGIPPKNVFLTGNTVVDALFHMRTAIHAQRPPLPDAAEDVIASERPFVLITAHRRENLGQGMRNICSAIATLAKHHPEYAFIWPLHSNPQVRAVAYKQLSCADNIHIILPCGYRAFLRLLEACRFVMTDSGGVQEEAPSLGKRVLVMRHVTERPEGVAAGFCTLVGTDTQDIVNAAEPLLSKCTPPTAENPYGDGKAAQRITAILEHELM